MSDKVGFFEENKNEKSMGRLLCFISLIASIIFGSLTILFADAATVSAGVVLSLIFLVGAMAPKAISKFAEIKLEALLRSNTEVK
jgi:hypothetical protein